MKEIILGQAFEPYVMKLWERLDANTKLKFSKVQGAVLESKDGVLPIVQGWDVSNVTDKLQSWIKAFVQRIIHPTGKGSLAQLVKP